MAREIRMPQLGESVTEGTIGQWLKEVGDHIEKYEPLLEVVTDKVDTEITSEIEGIVLDIKVPAGETVDVGTVLAVVGEAGEAVPAETREAPAATPLRQAQDTAEKPAVERADGKAPPKPPGAARISPVVSRIAAEHGVNVEDVPGTGRGGRVTKKDILKYIEERGKRREEAPPAAPARPLEEVPAAVPGEIMELTPMRRMIAEHMV
ncbi:MAG: biotin/lipoyl-containing protein, partial [Anaerolineae bacterium]